MLQQWFGEHARTVKIVTLGGLAILALILGLGWLNNRGKSTTAATTDPTANPAAASSLGSPGTLAVNVTDNQYFPPTSGPAPASQSPIPSGLMPASQAPTPLSFPSGIGSPAPIGSPIGHEGGPVPVPAIHPSGLNPVPAVLPPNFSTFDSTYYPSRN